jgi:hypothetical protein
MGSRVIVEMSRRKPGFLRRKEENPLQNFKIVMAAAMEEVAAGTIVAEVVSSSKFIIKTSKKM